jgi:hypothetical protein
MEKVVEYGAGVDEEYRRYRAEISKRGMRDADIAAAGGYGGAGGGEGGGKQGGGKQGGGGKKRKGGRGEGGGAGEEGEAKEGLASANLRDKI